MKRLLTSLSAFVATMLVGGVALAGGPGSGGSKVSGAVHAPISGGTKGSGPVHTPVLTSVGPKVSVGPTVGKIGGSQPNYHLTSGKSFSHGYFYPGKSHNHWTYQCYWNKYGCNCYWCPYTSCYYYWCEPSCCYYPISYVTVAPPVAVQCRCRCKPKSKRKLRCRRSVRRPASRRCRSECRPATVRESSYSQTGGVLRFSTRPYSRLSPRWES